MSSTGYRAEFAAEPFIARMDPPVRVTRMGGLSPESVAASLTPAV